MCICGDSECPSCGVAQGTKTDGGNMKELKVGALRQQSALCDANRRVVLIPSLALKSLLGDDRVVFVQSYPDTTDERGDWSGTFKLVAMLESECAK